MKALHFRVINHSRKTTTSLTCLRAYIRGELLYDTTREQFFDYRHKRVEYREVLYPEYAPEPFRESDSLWEAVEQAEKRRDARLCKEYEISLPRTLSVEQNIQLIQRFATNSLVSRGMIADVALHLDDPDNPHCHILTTTREVTPSGFGKKVRAWDRKEMIVALREEVTREINHALKEAGQDVTLDHRSYVEQGIDAIPHQHLGKAAHQIEKRGGNSTIGATNRLIDEANLALASNKTEDYLLKRKLSKVFSSQVDMVLIHTEKGTHSMQCTLSQAARLKSFWEEKEREGYSLEAREHKHPEARLALEFSSAKKPEIRIPVFADLAVLEAQVAGSSMKDLNDCLTYITKRNHPGGITTDGKRITGSQIKDFIHDKLLSELEAHYKAQIEQIKEHYGSRFRPERADWVVAKSLVVAGYSKEDIHRTMLKASPGLEERQIDPQQYVTETLEKLVNYFGEEQEQSQEIEI